MLIKRTLHRYNKYMNNFFIMHHKRHLLSSSSTVSEDYVRHKILSEKGKQTLIRKISRLKYKTGDVKGRQSAAILVPICIVNNHVSLLFTIRSTALSGYSGQISFPGGKMDKSDNSVADAALRETTEETGILKENIDVWVNAPAFPDRLGKYLVTPVIGYLGDISIESLNYNKEEVAEVISVPIIQLLDPESQRYSTFRNGWTMPVFRVHANKNIWGLTATITELFLSTVFTNDYIMKLNIYDRNKKISEKYL